jgi:DNA invertase Pin-like site-specific DNA recombinase
MVKRANDGRRVARAKGVKFGRKPKLTAHQQKEARKQLQAGDRAGSIAKFLGVHHATVLRVL